MAKSKKVPELQLGASTDSLRFAPSGSARPLGDTPPGISPSFSLPATGDTPREQEHEQISGHWRVLALALVALHLLAVFAEPLRFFSRSNIQVAPNAELVRNLVRPYSQFLFLDHGYFFFAPNPGPGHLIRILNSPEPVPSLEDDRRLTPLEEAKSLETSGSKIVQLPDRNVHTPRLLYHRYFMLSEFYYSSFAPPEIDPEFLSDSRVSALWKRDRDIYIRLKDSLHRYSRETTNLSFARVDRLERELPDVKTTLKDKVRISDIRWQYILPESTLPQSPRNSMRGDRSRPLDRNQSSPLDGPITRDRTRSPIGRAPIGRASSNQALQNSSPPQSPVEIIPETIPAPR